MFAYLRIIVDSCRLRRCLLIVADQFLPTCESLRILADRSGSMFAYLRIIADSCRLRRYTNNSLAVGFCRWIHDCPRWQRVPSQKFLLLLRTMFGSPSHLASVPDVPFFAFLAAPPWSRPLNKRFQPNKLHLQWAFWQPQAKMKVIWFCLQKTISGSYLKQNNSDLVFQTRTIFLKWVSS